MDRPIRLMIVDDHSIVRQGLRAILELEPSVVVVGEADDPDAALPKLATLAPDIVLLDLSFGSHGPARGLEACLRISTEYPAIGVIVLTTFLEERLVLQAIQNGAKGYVLKDVDAVDLIKMVRAVSRGEAALDTRITPMVLNTLSNPRPSAPQLPTLSDREREVLRLVSAGYSNREIGEQIAISASTVKYHLRNLMDKLNVNHRTELIYAAGKMGLL